MNIIYNSNCLEKLKEFSNDSIDLVVTSPPYDNLRKYNGYELNIDNIIVELFRITKKGGVVVWVVADATIKGTETGTSFRQALSFKSAGFNLHDTMIFAKKNPVPLTHNRYEQCFEYMFVFSKGKPKTFNPIKEPCITVGRKFNKNRKVKYDNNAIRHQTQRELITLPEKIKRNIWEYPIGVDKDSSGQHPATFPYALAADHIKSWSNEGDIVLDPFCGSGTTCLAAKDLKRNFIGIDISNDYCELAKKRIGI